MALKTTHLLSLILLLLGLTLAQGILLYQLLQQQQHGQIAQQALTTQEQYLEQRLAALQGVWEQHWTTLQTDLQQRLTPVMASSFPVGSIVAYAGTIPPDGWLLCAGQNLNQTDYPALHALLAHDPSVPQLTVPDLRGRFIAGLHPTDPDFQSLLRLGGEKSVVLKIEHLPPHSHSYWRSQYAGYVYDRFAEGNNKNAKELESQTNTVGEGRPHNNLPPYLTLNFIIRAK